jgi:hypothetical protein
LELKLNGGIMLRHQLPAILAAAVISVFVIKPSHAQFNLQTRIGVAEVGNKGDGCLTIMNASLQGNDVITLITLENPQSFIKTNIVNKLSQSCSQNTVIPQNASFYSFQVSNNNDEIIRPTIAIAGFNGSLKVTNGRVRADLNGDGRLESFRLCTSNEGLHLTVWIGEPLNGERLWHEYYYLGYDVEPTCTKRAY